jgi:DNA-binding NarL/FixJ family response regulator
VTVEGSSKAQARILVVDDEPFNVDYLEQELVSRGFAVETAADGVEALERIAAAGIDLILLDVMMPRLDGIETLRLVKSDPETRLIPVVLLTALNSIDDRVRGIEAGADDFLSKPFDDRQLLARIGTALAHRRAIEDSLCELDRARAHLERHGLQRREVAVLAVDWRSPNHGQTGEAAAFLARRHRPAAERWIREHGGEVCDESFGPVLAVFDGGDNRSRSVEAVEAALAIREAAAAAPGDIGVVAAVAAGDAWVGSIRVTEDGSPGWRYSARGEPVDRAVRLASTADSGAVLVTDDVRTTAARSFRFMTGANGSARVTARLDPADVRPATARRLVGTMVLADVVGSTDLAERVGDRAWGAMLAGFRRVLREEFERHGGEQVDAVGDAVLGLFANPSAALAAALAAAERVGELGMVLRAGVHTGEVDRVGGGLQGIAVHLTSRIGARARPGEVLASATTRELAAGAPVSFCDRGLHTLKGVAEPRRLYAVTNRAPMHAIGDAAASGEKHPAGLTAREVEVLQLVAAGLSDAEVAGRLVLSVRTVHAHVRSIYRKAGLRSRAAAGRFARERGLV